MPASGILILTGLMLMTASGNVAGMGRQTQKPSPKVDAWCPSTWHPSVLCSRHGDCSTKPWNPHPMPALKERDSRKSGKALTMAESSGDSGGGRSGGGRHSCFLPTAPGTPSSHGGLKGSSDTAPPASRRVTFVTALYDVKREHADDRGMERYTDWMMKTLAINANIILYTARGELCVPDQPHDSMWFTKRLHKRGTPIGAPSASFTMQKPSLCCRERDLRVSLAKAVPFASHRRIHIRCKPLSPSSREFSTQQSMPPGGGRTPI